jgi:hypothetical protein
MNRHLRHLWTAVRLGPDWAPTIEWSVPAARLDDVSESPEAEAERAAVA